MSRSNLVAVSSFCLGLVLLAPLRANADLLVWDLLATCPSGTQELKLKMTYSVSNIDWAPIRTTESQKLYGCSGACSTPGLLATSVSWKKTGHSCWCFPSMTVVDDAGACEPGDYAKCSDIVEATLPYSCDVLGYDKICVSPSCKAEQNPYGGGQPCAVLKPPTTANQCLTSEELLDSVLTPNTDLTASEDPTSPTNPAELDELGGCSVGAANASLMTLLLLVAGLSLMLSRRRRH